MREPAVVLIADDDATRSRALRSWLTTAGALSASCASAKALPTAVDFHRPHVVILELDMDGGRVWALLGLLRAAGAAILAIDRRPSPGRRRTALAAGVDDVLAPDTPAEELATRALGLAARGSTSAARRVFRRNGLLFDADARHVSVDGRPIPLTPPQMGILEALFEDPGAAVGRTLLADRIAGIDDDPPSDRAVDLHVSRLRRRLGTAAHRTRFIETVPGVGYRLAPTQSLQQAISPDASAVLDAVPQPVLLVDAELRVRHSNAAAQALTGEPAGALVGRHCGDVLDCRDEGGAALAPRCLGRAVLSGNAPLCDIGGSVLVPDGRVPVSFSCARVRAQSADDLVAVTLRATLTST